MDIKPEISLKHRRKSEPSTSSWLSLKYDTTSDTFDTDCEPPIDRRPSGVIGVKVARVVSPSLVKSPKGEVGVKMENVENSTEEVTVKRILVTSELGPSKTRDSMGRRMFFCFECTFTDSNADAIATHLKSHPYICGYCAFAPTTFAEYESHRTKCKTPVGAKPIYCCSQCSYTTKVASNIPRHSATHSTERPYKCDTPDCNYAAKSVKHLIAHKSRGHYAVRSSPPAQSHLIERPYKCDQCHYASKTVSDLDRHKSQHTSERLFKCETADCTYAAKTPNCLSAHMRNMHSDEKPHKCPECPFAGKTSQAIKKHSLKHTQDRPFQCEQCSFAGKSIVAVKLHTKKVHENPKSPTIIECPEVDCSFETTTDVRLRFHLKHGHPTSRPYKCLDCSYTARNRGALYHHKSTKHGYKPRFRCDQCEFSTHFKDKFAMHEKTHEGMEETGVI